MTMPKLTHAFIASITRAYKSFAALHSANALIGITFNLIQFIIFSRTFDTQRFSEIVLLTAVGIYALPLSQAVGRANFVALNSSKSNGTWAVEAALLSHCLLLIIASITSPYLVSSPSSNNFFENAIYVGICLANNVWYYDLQPIFWALDCGKAFERLTIIRRLVTFLTLPILWFTANFLTFVALMFAVNMLFFWLLSRMYISIYRNFDINTVRSQSRRVLLGKYLHLFWPALMSSTTELFVLNSPYAVFYIAFGTGQALIAYDTIMKLTRIAMTVARSLSESALPRLTRLFKFGETPALKRLLWLVYGICCLEGVLGATVMIVGGATIFQILLGPNNIMPPNLKYASAAIMLSGCFYTPSTYFLAFNGARLAVQRITILAVFGLVLFTGITLFCNFDVLAAIWAYAIFFGCISVFALLLTISTVVRANVKPSGFV